MKKYLLAFAILFAFRATLQAQSFSNTTGGPIADVATSSFPVTVSGLPSVIDTSFGLVSVRVNLNHTYDSDIKIYLKSAHNDSIMLSQNRGGSADNYTNTVFRMDATTLIQNGVAPFTGTFVPDGSLNLANGGFDPNGVWTLYVKDEVPADFGTMFSFTLNFGANPPSDPPPPPGPCSATNGQNCQCPDGSQDCDLLPDMTASTLIIQQQHTEYPGYLTLSNATPNIGWGPMEIHGVDSCYCNGVQVPCSLSVCPDGSPVKQLVKQTIYHKHNGDITSWRRSAGFMSYHPSHGHIHVDNWGEFTLRKSNGDSNPLNWPIMGTGTKMSFCLINLGDCTNNLGYCVSDSGNVITQSNIPNSPFGMVTGCGTDQGIFTGNLDIYSQGLAGMSINFGDICNGDYHIVSVTDPNDNFLELNENNNIAVVPITLTDQLPVPTASITSNTIGMNVAFNASTTNASSFSWNFGDGSPADTSNLLTIHNYANDGAYIVTFTASSACTTVVRTDTVFVGNFTVGLQNKVFDKAFAVSPNPFSHATTISYQLMNYTEVQLRILDASGREVKNFAGELQIPGRYQYIFDPENLGLSAGMYFLTFRAGDESRQLKMMYAPDKK
jgi:subtilisin-like proprotein convertase family protein